MGWLENEPRGRETLRREVRRLVRRALARKWLVLGLTVLITGVVVVQQALKRTSFAASATFRIDESSSAEMGQTAPPTRQLREYVIDTVLTHARCQQIIKKHDLYPSQMRRDPRLATDELQSDLDVNVSRDYFLEEARTNRSALLEVKYTANDPALAYEVVQDITTMVRERQMEEGRERARALARWTKQAAETARGKWEELRRQYSQKLVALDSARGLVRAQLLGETALLADAVRLAANDLAQAEQLKATGSMRLSLETKRTGLSFVLVDFEKPTAPRPWRLLTLAAVLFFLVLPIVAMTVGAFVPIVYAGEDVERLGLRVVGHVPAFPGWQSGTLLARQAGERWVVGGAGRPPAGL